MKIRTTFYRDVDPSGITGGDGNPLPPSLADVTATTTPQADGSATNPTITDVVDPAAPPAGDDTTDSKLPSNVEGVNADGTLQEGYIKNEAGEIVKEEPPADDPADDPEGDDEGQTPEEFFAEVAKHTGIEIPVEYPTDLDPLSPEGVAFRDKVLMERAVSDFEKHLETTDPRAYAYMLHRASGKPDSEFFGDGAPTGYTLPDKTLLDTDGDAQAAVYKYDLLSKGLTEAKAQSLVSMAIKDNTLLEEAKASYAAIEKAQSDQLAEIQRINAQQQEQFDAAVGTITSNITKAINSEIGFVVPDADKPAFTKFVMERLNYQDGKFYIVQPLEDTSLKAQVEALFLQHKNGDLSKIVQRQAKTVAAQRMRLGVNSAKQKAQSNQQAASTSSLPLPLSAMT